MMLIVSQPFQDNIVLTYIAGCLGATALEFVVGVAMERMFKVRYWDYSRKKFNYKGHICLSSTLAWGGFTILTTEVIHKPIETIALNMPYKLLTGITFFITIIFVADVALSVRAAIDIRELLHKMSAAKKEMSHILKRLEVLTSGVEAKKDGLVENLAGIKNGIKGSLSDLKQAIEMRLEKTKSLPPEYQEEVGEIKTRYAVMKEVISRFSVIKDFFLRDMLVSNDITSTEYEDSLDELKNSVIEQKDK